MKKRLIFSFVLLACLLLLFIAVSIMAGSVDIPIDELIRIFSGSSGPDMGIVRESKSPIETVRLILT